MVDTRRTAHAEATDGNIDNTPLSHDDAYQSDKDEDEVEEMLGNFSSSSGIAVDTALTGDPDEAHATVQYSDLAGNDGLQAPSQVELESISGGPRRENTMSQTSIVGSSGEKVEVEPRSSAHPQAAIYTEEVVGAGQLATPCEQSTEARVHSEPRDAAPSPAVAENEAIEHSKEMPIDEEKAVQSLNQAAARAVEHTEKTRETEAATRENKGKGKAKDLPSTDEASTGSKRSRDEDEDSGDTSPAEMEPDPSCSPIRRTRQRVGPPMEEEARTPTPPPKPNCRQHPWDIAAYVPETMQGIKRNQSLAPEPSERETVLERARSAGPPGQLESVRFTWNAVASSSRVTLDHLEAGLREENNNATAFSVRLEEQEIETLLDSPVTFQPVPPLPSLPTSTPLPALPFPLIPPVLNLPPPPTFVTSPPILPHQTLPPHQPNLLNRYRTPSPPSPPFPYHEYPFPPYLSPPGRALRRHDTTFIGRKVYRP